MKVRLLTALGILIFGLPLLIFSEYIVYPIGLSIVATASAWELLRVFGLDRRWAISIPTYLVTVCLPFFTYPIFFSSAEHTTYILIVALTLFAYLMYLSFILVISKGTLKYKDVASAFMSITYVTVSVTALGLLRYMVNGQFLFELVFIGAWVCDSMAYFTGRLLGKHKLAPVLSPKKTVEGAVGGVLFDIAAFLLYGCIIEHFFPSLDANYVVLGVSGFLISLIAIVGDLWASLIKREHGVKDYSNILPGHGGMLDRFDSVLSVSAVLMVICLLFPPFVGAA